MKQLLLGLLAILPTSLFSQALIHETHPLQRLAHPFDFFANQPDWHTDPTAPHEMPHINDLIDM